jgi:hypothetical protein
MIDRQQDVLPYYATERDLVQTAARLELALRRKMGHVVIIGESQDDADIFVSVVLDAIDGYQFVQLCGDLDFAQLPVPPTEGRTIGVIYNADELDAAAAAQAQLWAERNHRATGLLLVGTQKLASTLAQPEARILAGLVHTRIVLVRPQAEVAAEAKRSTRRKAVAGLLLGGAFTISLGFAIGAQAVSSKPLPLPAAVRETYASGLDWILKSFPAIAGTATAQQRLAAETAAAIAAPAAPLAQQIKISTRAK